LLIEDGLQVQTQKSIGVNLLNFNIFHWLTIHGSYRLGAHDTPPASPPST
jgi:hypothetical protein